MLRTTMEQRLDMRAATTSPDPDLEDTSAIGTFQQPGLIGIPRIRLSTFHNFRIQIDGRPLSHSRKSQQRPLSLLKLVIAKGGHDVSCAYLCETLWSNSDGDLSARNLTITLHRLRNLLGANAAVLHHDGKLSLNPRTCWVDVWEFEQLADAALRAAPAGGGKAWEDQLRAALDLYVGDFLALEAEESWMLEPRLRWKTRFERIVSALSSRLESTNRFDEAVDVCQQALEIEPLNEILYRRLMNCYLVRGEIAAVVRVYSSCRDALGKGLATRPALETERIYRAALEASAAAVYRSGSQPVRPANAPS